MSQSPVVGPNDYSALPQQGQREYNSQDGHQDFPNTHPVEFSPTSANSEQNEKNAARWGINSKLFTNDSNASNGSLKTSGRPGFLNSIGISNTGSWVFEIISLFLGLGAVAAIIGVLARFDGRPLPEWPHWITLNAILAILTTVLNANIAMALQNGLSQMKWVRFRAGRAPLSDMETFDQASRSALGQLKLLVTARGGFIGSLGALVALVSLAVNPFTQQITSYPSRIQESTGNTFLPRALKYEAVLVGNGTNSFVPILPMKFAVYGGIFSENGRPTASLPFGCPTGNCTWDEFETLAVCHQCENLTPLLSRYCVNETLESGNSSSCGWQLPGGARSRSSSEVFTMMTEIPKPDGDMSHTTFMRLTFMGTESQNGTQGELSPWAQRCTLQACVQTIKSEVVNGELSENSTSSILNNTIVDLTANPDIVYPVNVRSKSGIDYTVGMGAMLGIRTWFGSTFTNGSASRNSSYVNQTITQDTVVVNLTVGISKGKTFFDSDIITAFYWNYYEYSDGLPRLMNDLAKSMTTAMRSFEGAVHANGTALSYETYVHVRWGFVALPVFVVLFAAIFLAAAIFKSSRSRTELWKSSALALLFHGLDEETRRQFGSTTSLDGKKRQANDVRVQLASAGEAGSLLRS